MESLHKLLTQIERIASHATVSDRKLIEKCLSDFVNLIHLSAQNEPLAQEALPAVSRYLAKKSSDVEVSSSSSSGTTTALRQLRNEVIHGKSMKRLDYLRVKKLDPVLWRTLEMSAQLWDTHELSNFLSYCLRTEVPRLDPSNVDPKKLVRVYRAIYNTLDDADKEKAFKELALRLFSEKRFVVTLEENFS